MGMTRTCTGASRAGLSLRTSADPGRLRLSRSAPSTSRPAWTAAPAARVRTAPPARLRALQGHTHWPAVPRATPSPWLASPRLPTPAPCSTAAPRGQAGRRPTAPATSRCSGGHSPCPSEAPARTGWSRATCGTPHPTALTARAISARGPGGTRPQCSRQGSATFAHVAWAHFRAEPGPLPHDQAWWCPPLTLWLARPQQEDALGHVCLHEPRARQGVPVQSPCFLSHGAQPPGSPGTDGAGVLAGPTPGAQCASLPPHLLVTSPVTAGGTTHIPRVSRLCCQVWFLGVGSLPVSPEHAGQWL